MTSTLFKKLVGGVLLSIFGLVFASANIAFGAFNEYINYQGKLTDSAGLPVDDGSYHMEFKIYDAPVGGTLLWTETRTSGDVVPVVNGLFSVLLGEVDSLSALDFNQPLYLSVNIGGTGAVDWDGEMTPRKQLSTVPTALLAKNSLTSDVADTALALDATNATSTNATTTNFYVTNFTLGADTVTDLTGTGLIVSGGALTVSTSSLANLNADLLDSLDSTQFLRSDASDAYTSGTLTFDAGTTIDFNSTNISFADTSIVFDGASTNFDITGDFSINTDMFVIDKSTGNVGVATPSPWKTFSVDGDLSVTGAFFDSTASAGTNGMVLQTTGSGTQWVATSSLGFPSASVGAGTTGQMPYYAADGTALTATSSINIKSNGGVIIGGSLSGPSPAGLHILNKSGTDDNTVFATSDYSYFAGGSSLTVAFDPTVGVPILNASSFGGLAGNNLGLQTITGNVGIGTTTPNSKLVIVDGSNTFSFNKGSGDITPNISLGTSGGKSLALLAGGSGTTFTFDASGFFSIASDTKANIDGGSSDGGALLMTVLGNGNVGIGENSPSHKLHVVSSIPGGNGSAIWATNLNDNSGSAVSGHTVDFGEALGVAGFLGGRNASNAVWYGVAGTASNPKGIGILGLAEDGGVAGAFMGGNVGVGSTSPWKTLSVEGDLSVTGAFFDASDSAGTNGMVLQSTGSGTQWVATSSLGLTGVIGSGTTGQVPYYASNGTALTATSAININTDGQVFIGGELSSPNPGARTHIVGSGLNTIFATDDYEYFISGGALLLGFDGSDNSVIDAVGAGGFGSAGLSLQTGSTAPLIVGYSAPMAKLTVLSDDVGCFSNSFYVADTIGDTSPFIIDCDGNVAIGTSSTAHKFEVYGDVNTTDRYKIDGTQALYIPGGDFAGSIFVGDGGQSLSYTTGFDGRYNTGFGIGAMSNIETGYSNTAVGALALNSNTVGAGNVAIGPSALQSNISGGVNIAIGGNALIAATSSDNNIAIGTYAGNTSYGSNNILIGFTANSPSSYANYALNIANAIYGDLNTSVKTIGIGSTTPYAKLTVTNTGSMPSFIVEDSASDSSPFVIDSVGNVGVGSTSPWKTLSVEGDLSVTGAFFDASDSAGTNGMVLQTTGSGTQWVATSSLGLTGVIGSGTTGQVPYYASNGTELSATSTLNINSSGQVGIGLTNQDVSLKVNGVINSVVGNAGGAIVQGVIDTANSFSRAVFSHNAWWDGVNDEWVVDNIGANDTQAILIPNGGGFQFITHGTTGNVSRTFNHADFIAGAKMTLTMGGNLGIGTASPGAKLEIDGSNDMLRLSGSASGDTNVGYMTFYDDDGVRIGYVGDASTGNDNIYLAADDGAVILTGGNVGVGVTDPTASLHVDGIIKGDNGSADDLVMHDGAGNPVLRGVRANSFLDATSTSFFQVGSTTDNVAFTSYNGTKMNRLQFISSSTLISAGAHGAITPTGLFSIANTSNAEVFYVEDSGRIGIGTTSPYADSKLDVSTNVTSGYGIRATNWQGVGGGTGRAAIRGDSLNAGGALGLSGMLGGYTGSIWYGVLGTAGSPNTYAIMANASDGAYAGLFSGGFVGIGNYAPRSRLTVHDVSTTSLTGKVRDVAEAGIVIDTNYIADAYTPGIFWSARDNQASKTKAGIWTQSTSVGSNMFFGTSNNYATGITNSALSINHLGSVGVGTTSPWKTLSVSGTLSVTGSYFDSSASAGTNGMVLRSTGSGTQWVATSTLGLGGGGGSGTVGSGTTGQIPYYASNGTTLTATSALSISTAGHIIVGGGTDALIRRGNTSSALALYGGTGETAGAYFNVTGNDYTNSPGPASAEFVIGGGSSKFALFSRDGGWTEIFRATGGSGRVNILDTLVVGTSLDTVGDSTLNIAGEIESTNLLGGATTLSTDANGVIIRTPSDEKLKKNIVPIENALAKVLQLNGVTYYWKDTERFGTAREIGLIAQQIEGIVPEVVKSGGEYKSVNYQTLVALLIEAIKEQQVQLETLEGALTTPDVWFNIGQTLVAHIGDNLLPTEENESAFVAMVSGVANSISEFMGVDFGTLGDFSGRLFTAMRVVTFETFTSTLTILPQGTLALPEGQNEMIGYATIPEGQTSVFISNNRADSSARIFLTPITPIMNPLYVSEVRPGEGFEVFVGAPQSNEIGFDWLMVFAYGETNRPNVESTYMPTFEPEEDEDEGESESEGEQSNGQNNNSENPPAEPEGESGGNGENGGSNGDGAGDDVEVNDGGSNGGDEGGAQTETGEDNGGLNEQNAGNESSDQAGNGAEGSNSSENTSGNPSTNPSNPSSNPSNPSSNPSGGDSSSSSDSGNSGDSSGSSSGSSSEGSSSGSDSSGDSSSSPSSPDA